MEDARVLHAGLQLLDRQLVDRNGVLCGKVDDLELKDENGTLYVSALLTGPGALLSRWGHTRAGAWMRRFVMFAFPSKLTDPGRIPLQDVAGIGNHITLGADHTEIATFSIEKWALDNVIAHIPGNNHNADS